MNIISLLVNIKQFDYMGRARSFIYYIKYVKSVQLVFDQSNASGKRTRIVEILDFTSRVKVMLTQN
jgi:hypothetical protein